MFCKMAHQQRYILFSIIQRRHLYRYHVQAVEQVLAETSFGYLLFQVFVCRCQYAHIHLDRFVATHTGDLVLLQRTQHFRLRRQTHVAYLVEEECSAVGLLKLTRTIFDGAGETTLGMSKQLTLNQFARYSGAVHLHHGLLGAGTVLVNEMCHHLFARTVATGDHHSRFGRRYFLYYLTHSLNGSALAYHLIAGSDLLAQHFGLLHQRLMLNRMLRGQQQAVEVEGLNDEVKRTFLECLYGSLHGAVT